MEKSLIYISKVFFKYYMVEKKKQFNYSEIIVLQYIGVFHNII